MIRDKFKSLYFDWMCRLVCSKQYLKKLSYRKLLLRLNEIAFVYILEMDENRYKDGLDLRYRFAYECNIDDHIIDEELEKYPCSVLEMMVALALRCEEDIMDNPDIGNRIGQWFWNMIVNLNLGSMTDDKFNQAYVDEVIDIFLNRQYEPNGKGGLFSLKCKEDLRKVEIWYQMCWYLDSVL